VHPLLESVASHFPQNNQFFHKASRMLAAPLLHIGSVIYSQSTAQSA
jgi:hypothetical protein